MIDVVAIYSSCCCTSSDGQHNHTNVYYASRTVTPLALLLPVAIGGGGGYCSGMLTIKSWRAPNDRRQHTNQTKELRNRLLEMQTVPISRRVCTASRMCIGVFLCLLVSLPACVRAWLHAVQTTRRNANRIVSLYFILRACFFSPVGPSVFAVLLAILSAASAASADERKTACL